MEYLNALIVGMHQARKTNSKQTHLTRKNHPTRAHTQVQNQKFTMGTKLAVVVA